MFLICIFFWVTFRVVLMGEESCLQSVAEKITGSLKGSNPIDVIGLTMEAEKEAVFDEAVEKAWQHLGTLDAFVNCYAYEGAL